MGKWYTVEEAAAELRVGRTTAYELILAGQLKSVRVGRARRVPAEAIDEFKSEKVREAGLVEAASA